MAESAAVVIGFSRNAPRRELTEFAIFRSCPRKLVSTHLAHRSSSVSPAFRQDCEVGLSQNWARVAVEYAPWYSGPVIIALVADA
jgi:hypothetical protein